MFMDDAYIEAAMSVPCCCCPANTGQECTEPASGEPLLETKGHPVHMRRLNG